jgi:predicted phosphodiesterase
MRLHIMSDLHFCTYNQFEREEFFNTLAPKAGEADVLILAGDICRFDRKYRDLYFDILKKFSNLYPVVLAVHGNHESWKGSIAQSKVYSDNWEKLIPNVQWLYPDRKFFKLGGLTFGGGTGWFPKTNNPMLDGTWSDFGNIRDSRNMIYSENQKMRDMKELPDIVVTHHFPTFESVAEMYRGDECNVYFSAHLEDRLLWLADNGIKMPKLLVHGHSHAPFDYQSQFGFRVYANPQGYPHEGLNDDFWDRITVDV